MSSEVIKQVMPKRKRFTVISVQLTTDPSLVTVDVSSSSAQVLALDADAARALAETNLPEGSVVAAVLPGYVNPIFIRE